MQTRHDLRRTFLRLALVLVASCAAAFSPAAEPAKLNYADWNSSAGVQQWPDHAARHVLRNTVESICHRENPTFDLKGTLPEDKFALPELAARMLFPDDKPRALKRRNYC